MRKTVVFPPDESAGTLFIADRAYCLDESLIEPLGEAMGSITLPDCEYAGLIFNENVPLRRRVLRELDLSCIQILYFKNPFQFEFDDLTDEPGQLMRAVLNCDPDDEDCALLAALPGLRAVDLSDANISDQGFKLLCEIQSLESLVVACTDVSDFGLACLPRLIDLRELDLSMTLLTDGGLKNLAVLKTLEELRLMATAVTDDGIAFLSDLNRLKFLDLSETAVSEDAISLLQANIPDCQISF